MRRSFSGLSSFPPKRGRVFLACFRLWAARDLLSLVLIFGARSAQPPCELNKKPGCRIYLLIFRQPGCLRETLGFPPHPRGWFSIIVYQFIAGHSWEWPVGAARGGQQEIMSYQLPVTISRAQKSREPNIVHDISASRLST